VSERARLLDQIALIDALARHVIASREKRTAETELVRLARRLTENWKLSDAEALRLAGADALSNVARASSLTTAQEKETR